MKNKNNSNFYLLTVLVFLFLLGNSQWLAAQDPLVIENDTVTVNGTLEVKGKATLTGGLRVVQNVSIGSNHEFAVDAVNIPGGRFVIKPNGNVGIGIGTLDPGTKLDINGDLRANGATFTNNATINNALIGVFGEHGYEWAGFGHSSLGGEAATYALLQNEKGSTTLINIKKSNGSTGYIGFMVDNKPKMVIKENGNVGIGFEINEPSALLHVGKKERTYEAIAGGHTDKVGISGSYWHQKIAANTTRDVSILSDGDLISKTGFNIMSDIRIKKNILPTSTLADLSTLRAIQVVDYNMIDDIADDRSYKKVIAQQVQEVYPLAVREGIRSFLPSVFQASQAIEVIGAGEYRLAVATDHELAVDDRVDLKCYPGNSSVTATVSRIISPTEFVVQSATELSANAFIFVYGKEVDDLLSVDYDAIAMLNVSATQELAQQVEQLQQEKQAQAGRITELEKQLQLEKQVQAARITELEKQLQGMEALKASVEQLQLQMNSEGRLGAN